MAKIYLIRHGESVANTEGRYQGQPVLVNEILETNYGLWEGKTKEEIAKQEGNIVIV